MTERSIDTGDTRSDTIVDSDDTVVTDRTVLVTPTAVNAARRAAAAGLFTVAIADPGSEHPRAVAERGLSRGLPVTYPARAVSANVPVRVDSGVAQFRFGAVPEVAVAPVRDGRAALPSLARRDRRRRAFTLGWYVTVLIGCVLGLWRVAGLVLG